jgi:hypothetical protein
MKTSFIFEKFEDYISSQYTQINEAEEIKTGFLAILGSTDSQNLGATVAPKIGIKPDTIYTITVNGEKDLISLGRNKKYEGFSGMKEDGKSKPKEDYISIKTTKSNAEIKPAVSAKGNIILDFDKGGVIEVKASNNGLLSFLRACSSMEKACEGKDSFSDREWIGKILISMGNPPSSDTSRNAAYLAINSNVNGPNPLRKTQFEEIIDKGNNKGILSKYITESKEFNSIDILLEEESPAPDKPAGENIKVIGDSIADALRAAQYYHATGRLFVNNFGPYKGFRDAAIKYKETLGKEEWTKASRINKSSFILAVLLQQIFKSIGESYPMDFKNQDLAPDCKEILELFGGKEDSVKVSNLGQGREILQKMLAFYQPTSYEKIPAFDPVLDGFWESLTNSLTSRASITFKNNVNKPLEGDTEGDKVETEGKEKSETKKNVSGGVG